MIFKTPRLIVRRLTLGDLEPFHEMQANIRVMRYTTGKAMTMEENFEDLKKVIRHYDEPDNDFWVWAIVHEENNRELFVGTCAVVKNDQDEFEIGYRFLEKYWGNRFGTEITKGLIEHCLNTMKIETLYAYVHEDNKASIAILEKSKMRFIREQHFPEEGFTDRVYGIGNVPKRNQYGVFS